MPTALKWKNHADLAIDRRPSVSRREFLDYMTFQANERPLFTELFGPILGLKEQWEEQGADEEELSFRAFRYRCHAQQILPVNTGLIGGFPEEVLEENDDYKITRDALGRTMKLPKACATLPLPLDFPVKTMDDWLKIKPWYEFSEERLAGDWEATARRAQAEERVVGVAMPGGFDEPRQLMGEEGLCMAFYTDPELIHDMLETMTRCVTQVLERVTEKVTVDLLSVHEDMAGKSGPLAGPDQVREYCVPYYRAAWDIVSDRGGRLFDQDSDGDMRPVLDAFLESGLNLIHPCEPAAGMDVVTLRERYGKRLAFAGGLDKYVIAKGPEAIDRELEYKLPPMFRSGAFLASLDHRIPNDTPLEHYRYYIRRVWEIIECEFGG